MKVAILIGVEQYADARIQPTPFAESDARGLAAVLEQQGFAATGRAVLINEQATKSSLESRLKRALQGLGQEDEFILYYAGHVCSRHGANFLTCYDTDPDDLADTSLKLQWLCEQFQRADCRQIAFLCDARVWGLPAIDEFDSHLDEAELADFFAQHEHYVCLAACRGHESSHASNSLRQGIWTHHVMEAFAGRAPAALVEGVYLTSGALQNYLQREVPRTLTKTFTTKKVQTPWMLGGRDGNYCLADLTDMLAKDGMAQGPQSQVRNVALLARRTQGVRSLSGFQKSHKEPERASSAAAAFIAKIASDEITGDVQNLFGKFKSAFAFKRADMHVANRGDGTATIITPYFNYSIAVELDSANTSQVVFCRTVDAIKDARQIFSEPFAKVFEKVFDTVRFETPGAVDLAALIDRLEACSDDRITIDYDPAVTYCSLHVTGVTGAITVTPRSLSIVHARPAPPENLLQSLFALQKVLVEQHDIRLIPWNDVCT